ncbi:MAG: zinc ribbon domain-containing protein [Oscillospiraceae bacterium]|nr:zinc ribbon domain-containing protein [Oscillospiraceae bacterium]
MAQKYCTNCGEAVNDGDTACPKCGEPVPGAKPAEDPAPADAAEAKIAVAERPQMKPALQETAAPEKKAPEDAAPPARSRYAPVSTFGFLLMDILLLIPVLNLILLFVWARKNSKKINRRNFARGTLIFLLLVALFAVACFFFGDVMFGGIVTKYSGFLSGIGLQSIVDLWGNTTAA